MSPATLAWFRLDLRLADNPALSAAAVRGGPVIPVYVWAPEEESPWSPGPASRWWLHQSLLRFDESLRKLGSRLIVRKGPTQEALEQLAGITGADCIVWSRRYEPVVRKRDRHMAAALRKAGIAVEECPGNLLLEPERVRTKEGKPYRVFTPFWLACRRHLKLANPLDPPRRLEVPTKWPKSLKIEELELEPKVDWASGFREVWTPGEAGAAKRLEVFTMERVDDYSQGRNRPDREGTSRLSPHLHFGEISPRQIWHALHPSNERRSAASTAQREKYLAEIGWREFAHHILLHFANTSDHPLREEFSRFRWRKNAGQQSRWQRGQTGYPIVDAGMRELWHTGWMHNRVRMIVASFLTKDLLLPWKTGARWFWNTLVDADLANNTMGWQWTSGCGADAAPFFRIFNPTMQGKKFDPQGHYVRRWIPELAGLPNRWIHAPWLASAAELHSAGVMLGTTYPLPIVDHQEARGAALAAFRSLREAGAP